MFRKKSSLLLLLCLLFASFGFVNSSIAARPTTQPVAKQPSRAANLPTFGSHFPVSLVSNAGDVVIASDPTNPRRHLVAVLADVDVAAYLSENDGATWLENRFRTTSGVGYEEPAVTFAFSDTAYLSYTIPDPCDSGIFVRQSLDAGRYWRTSQRVLAARPLNYGSVRLATDQNPTSPYRGRTYISGAGTDCYTYAGRLAIAYTNDGLIWTDTYVTTPLPAQVSYHNLTVAGDGSLYIVYREEPSRNMITRSTDGGLTWSQPTTISASVVRTGATRFQLRGLYGSNIDNYLFTNDQPLVATSPTNPNEVYALWSDGRWEQSFYIRAEPGQHSDIAFSRSTDGGVTWTTPRRLNDDPAGRDQFVPAMAVGSDGTIHVVWLDRRGAAFRYRPFYTQSLDGGLTWSANQPVTDEESTPSLTSPQRSGLVVSRDNSAITVVWSDERGLGRVYGARGSFGAPPPPPNPAPPPRPDGQCASGQREDALFSDDMEVGTGNWTTGGVSSTWRQLSDRPRSGQYAWFANEPAALTDQQLTMASEVQLPANAAISLRFWHQHQFDWQGGSFGGGVIELSTDNGNYWQDLGPLITQNSYYNVIDSRAQTEHALWRRWAFSNGGSQPSWGYKQTVADLSQFAGQRVKLRFRLGSDIYRSGLGWYVDDVELAACLPQSGAANTQQPAAKAGQPQPANSCAVDENRVNLFSDDMEAGDHAWYHDGSGDTWQLIMTDTRSAPGHAWSARVPAGYGVATDQRLTLDPISIPLTATSAQIGFWHRYGFSLADDGGWLEFSTDGGQNWISSEPLVISNTYNSSLRDPVRTYHFSKQAAFASGSPHFVYTVADLSRFAGQQVMIRFHVSTNYYESEAFAWYGWLIDDVQVSACLSGQPATATPTACAQPNLLQNGDFETGSLNGWQVNTVNYTGVATDIVHSGNYAAVLGRRSGGVANVGSDQLTQNITVPAAGATLSFWFWPYESWGFPAREWQAAYILDQNGEVLATVMKVISKAQRWQEVRYDLSRFAGQTVQVRFDDYQEYGQTWMYVDDVMVAANNCGLVFSPTPTRTPVDDTATPTRTRTVVPSATATRTNTPVATPSVIASRTPTASGTPPTNTPAPTRTPAPPTSTPPASTSTPAATFTTPVSTSTPLLPTSTFVVTRTPAPVSSATSTSAATATAVGATTTRISTNVATATTMGATATSVATAPATASPCTVSFTDVGTGNIFYADIQFLACRGVIGGFPNGDGTFRFEPNSNTTRGQFAKIATLGFGLPAYTPTLPTFVDVSTSNIFYQYIEAAANASALQGLNSQQCAALGTPGRCFGPNLNVSRAQVAVIVLRARGYSVTTPPTPTFSDVPPSNFAYAAIETLAGRGIISGAACGGGQCFRPNDNIRRGELSKVVRRAIQNQP